MSTMWSYWCAQMLNRVPLFATPWTVAHKAPLSMGFPRQEYWSGLPFPPPAESPWPRDWTWVSHISCTGRVPQNSKEREESLLKWTMQRNRGKQQNGKGWRSLQENWKYQGNIMQGWATIKDRNGKDLSKVKDIKKMWQEYTEELYKKGLKDQGNHNGVITHLELNILEREVKWALGSITTNNASGSDRIPAELFKILKDDAVTLNMSAHL